MPPNESFPSPDPIEQSEALKRASESVESVENLAQLADKWEQITESISAALEGPGENIKQTSRELVNRLIKTLSEFSAGNIVAQRYTVELQQLLSYAEKPEVKNFVDHVTSLNPEEKKQFFMDNLDEALDVPEETAIQLEAVDLMGSLLTGYMEMVEDSSSDPAYAKRSINKLRDDLAKARVDIVENPGTTIQKALRGAIDYFNNPQLLLGSSSMNVVDFSNLKTAEDLGKVKAQVINALGSIQNYSSAETLIAETFADEVEQVKTNPKVQQAVEWKINSLTNKSRLELYSGQFNQYVAEGFTWSEARAECEKAIDFVVEKMRPQIEAHAALTYIGENWVDQGKFKIAPDEQAVWTAAQNMFDYQDEYFTLADTNEDTLAAVVTEVAIWGVSVAVPELAAARAIEAGGAMIRAYRLSKGAMDVARSIGWGGRLAVGTGKVLLSSAISEAVYTPLNAALHGEDVAKAMRENPWLTNIIINGAVSGWFDLPNELTSPELKQGMSALSGMQSRGAILLGRKLLQEGYKKGCAAIIATEIKNGAYNGDADAAIAWCGEELYRLCGEPDL